MSLHGYRRQTGWLWRQRLLRVPEFTAGNEKSMVAHGHQPRWANRQTDWDSKADDDERRRRMSVSATRRQKGLWISASDANISVVLHTAGVTFSRSFVHPSIQSFVNSFVRDSFIYLHLRLFIYRYWPWTLTINWHMWCQQFLTFCLFDLNNVIIFVQHFFMKSD